MSEEKQIASFLISSGLYNDLTNNNDGIFDISVIPEEYMLYNDDHYLIDITDFMNKLDIFEYWRTYDYPDCYYQFIYNNYKLFDSNILSNLLDKYNIDLKLVIDCFINYENDIILENKNLLNQFVKIAHIEWLQWLYNNKYILDIKNPWDENTFIYAINTKNIIMRNLHIPQNIFWLPQNIYFWHARYFQNILMLFVFYELLFLRRIYLIFC